jgi:tRNA G46 methylase TrmB
MHSNSSPVISNQASLHEQLEATVRKHLQTQFQRPIAEHAKHAWQQLKAEWGGTRPLVLDSGCGTAQSTLLLAEKHADCLVVGVDRSISRLEKRKQLPSNALLLRTNLEDLWRLMAADEVQLAYHYLLYPNPYPKAAQLRYRWHGSPVFPILMQLGGELTLRSNWDVYLQEFQCACELAGKTDSSLIELPYQQQPLTAFEDKYQASQQALWQLSASL